MWTKSLLSRKGDGWGSNCSGVEVLTHSWKNPCKKTDQVLYTTFFQQLD
jgi:hypothetical protein